LFTATAAKPYLAAGIEAFETHASLCPIKDPIHVYPEGEDEVSPRIINLEGTPAGQINPSSYEKRVVLRQEPRRSKYSLLSSTQTVRIKKRAEFPRAD
jgi:hypothetical protein